MRRIHAVTHITIPHTLCGRNWRKDTSLSVETKWERVTCKRCQVEVRKEYDRVLELEGVLRDTPGTLSEQVVTKEGSVGQRLVGDTKL